MRRSWAMTATTSSPLASSSPGRISMLCVASAGAGAIAAYAPAWVLLSIAGVTALSVAVKHATRARPIDSATAILATLGISGALLYLVPNRLAFAAPTAIEPALRLLTIPITVSLLAALAILRPPKTARNFNMERLGITATLLLGAGLAISLWRNNDLWLVLGDSWKLGITAIVLILAGPLDRRSSETILIFAGITAVLLDGAWLLIYLWNAAQGGYQRLGGGSLLGLALATYLLLSPRIAHRRLGAALVAGELVLAALSLSRGTALASALALAPLLRLRQMLRRFTGTGILLLLLSAAVATYFPDTASETISARYRSLLTGFDRQDDTSLTSRAGEAQSAFAEAQESATSLLVGRGLGAEFVTRTDGTDAHQIHITPVSVLFRHGIVGLLWILALYYWLLRISLATVKNSRDIEPHLTAAASLVIGTIALSTSTYVLIGQPIVFLAAAMLTERPRRSRSPSAAARGERL